MTPTNLTVQTIKTHLADEHSTQFQTHRWASFREFMHSSPQNTGSQNPRNAPGAVVVVTDTDMSAQGDRAGRRAGTEVWKQNSLAGFTFVFSLGKQDPHIKKKKKKAEGG